MTPVTLIFIFYLARDQDAIMNSSGTPVRTPPHSPAVGVPVATPAPNEARLSSRLLSPETNEHVTVILNSTRDKSVELYTELDQQAHPTPPSTPPSTPPYPTLPQGSYSQYECSMMRWGANLRQRTVRPYRGSPRASSPTDTCSSPSRYACSRSSSLLRLT